ncbi:MAG: hypothetical protein P5697_26105, partial [Limnospira sp. PMC 1256.20]|uniref:hypothetical protein n=2 Tax=unclassified Limnospira TaxID=2642885 RepID=UPI0028E0E9A5
PDTREVAGLPPEESCVKPKVDPEVVREFGLRTIRLRVICQMEYEPEEKWRQAVELGKALNGLTLTGLPATMRRKMDRHLGQINPILEQYTIESWEDYAQLTGEELEEIRQIFLNVCDLAPAKYR